MERSLLEVEAIVRDRICRVCSDRTADGQCGLEEPRDCSLFRMFPQVAKAIQATRSDDIMDYVRAIREQVCAACQYQASNGSCEKRKEVRCALDAYLLLVVDAIEEATGKSFDRAALNGQGFMEVRL
ncbi:MAG: hypothetical protein HYR60_08675 [Acidobacteria bacterium]|nr:hypothetical protein [Acidobacteriota bacterium]MBI3470324.1 hypothetical protein [Candidatus Solibacter usitatus]